MTSPLSLPLVRPATLNRTLAPYVLLVAAAMLTAVVWTVRESRRQRLRRIRGEWAQPRDRVHKMEAVVASHRARLAVTPTGRSTDHRTWDDLNLDAVFAMLDHTDSTLGQCALYHRLRTAPLADHLEAAPCTGAVGVAYMGSSQIGYSLRVRGLLGAGSRSALPLRFSVISEYGGLIP